MDINKNPHLNCPSYFYKAFGLILASNIALPELCSADIEPADATISSSSLNPEEYGGTGKEFHHLVAPDFFYLQIHAVGRYCVIKGQTILVDPEPEASHESIRLYILGSCIGILLLQRGVLPLHGSSIATPAGGILFLGDSGIGKSTLAAAFCSLGYPLLSDDICALTLNHTGNALLHPAYPQLKLLEDSLSSLNMAASASQRLSESDSKYRITESVQFQDKTVQINKIFILEKSDQEDIAISQLTGIEKFTSLTEHIYRGVFIEQLEIAEPQFRQCAKLCETTAIYRIVRPSTTFDLEKLTSLILDHCSPVF